MEKYNLAQKFTSSVTLALPLAVIFATNGSSLEIDQRNSPLPFSYFDLSLKKGTGGQLYNFAETVSIEEHEVKVLENFVTKLLNNTKDMDADIAQIVNENFWDIYERF
jgi:hypothetical protein